MAMTTLIQPLCGRPGAVARSSAAGVLPHERTNPALQMCVAGEIEVVDLTALEDAAC